MASEIVPMATHVLPLPQGPRTVPLLPTPNAEPAPQEVKEELPGEGSFARNWKNPYLPYFSVDIYPDDNDNSFRAPEQRRVLFAALKKLQSKNPGFKISPKDDQGVSNYFKDTWFGGKVPTKKAYDDVIQKFRALQDTTHPVIKRKTAAAATVSRWWGDLARKLKKKQQQKKTEKIKKQVDNLLPHFDYAGGKRKHRRTKRHKKRKKKRRKKTRKYKRRKRRKTRRR